MYVGVGGDSGLESIGEALESPWAKESNASVASLNAIREFKSALRPGWACKVTVAVVGSRRVTIDASISSRYRLSFVPSFFNLGAFPLGTRCTAAAFSKAALAFPPPTALVFPSRDAESELDRTRRESFLKLVFGGTEGAGFPGAEFRFWSGFASVVGLVEIAF